MDAAILGRSWPPHSYEVELEKIREYALAVGELAPHHHDREAARVMGFPDVPAPPLFAAVFCAPAVAMAIFDPAVGLFDPERGIASYRFVHKAQRFEWLRPVKTGDVISTEVTLVDASEHEDGRAIRGFESVSTNAEGYEVVRARYEGVVPPPAGSDSRSRAARGSEGLPPLREALSEDPMDLHPGDQLAQLTFTPDPYAAIRYAGASGDFTPFHLDSELAQSMGLDGAILHGLYSFAQLARAHTSAFGGDPRALTSLSGRFKRPAYPGRELDVRVSVEGIDRDCLFTDAEVTQAGVPVIAEARGKLRRPGQ